MKTSTGNSKSVYPRSKAVHWCTLLNSQVIFQPTP